MLYARIIKKIFTSLCFENISERLLNQFFQIEMHRHNRLIWKPANLPIEVCAQHSQSESQIKYKEGMRIVMKMIEVQGH